MDWDKYNYQIVHTGIITGKDKETGKIIQYQSCGRYTIDPVNLVQSFCCRPSQGKIVPVYVGSEFSHSLCEIINAFNPNIDLNK